MALQPVILSETIVGEDSSHPLNVVYHEESGHIVIDYSKYYERIAAALETLVTQTTTIATQTTNIATQTTTLATKLTEIENHQQRMRELGEGEGIRIISPFELFSFVTSYRSLIEEGRILKWRDAEPSEKDVAKALNDLGKYIEKVRTNIPRGF
jgi:hypothetical protein